MIHPAAITSLLFGAFLLLCYGWLAMKPEPALRIWRAYPRTVWPGRILAAICVLWFARNLWQVDLGGFNEAKKILYVAVPVAIYLVVVFLPDLLSVRGLCAFILLGAQPLLVATRWSGTPASFAVALLVYALIIKSMFLVVYPHMWIRGLDAWKEHHRVRLTGMFVGVGIGLAMLTAGVLSL